MKCFCGKRAPNVEYANYVTQGRACCSLKCYRDNGGEYVESVNLLPGFDLDAPGPLQPRLLVEVSGAATP